MICLSVSSLINGASRCQSLGVWPSAIAACSIAVNLAAEIERLRRALSIGSATAAAAAVMARSKPASRCVGQQSELSHPGFDAVLVLWLSGPEKETVCHGTSPEVFR